MQQAEKITRQTVFTLSQRLTHWIIALAVIFQLLSAWLVQHSDVDVVAWFEWHLMVGQAMIVALLYRLFLLFRPGSGHWRLLVPTREQRHVALQTLKFYLSLGRLNSPDWYAYNPIWQPLYLLLIVLLVLTAATGLLAGSYLFAFGFSISQLHGILAALVLAFSIAHPLFVVLHDARGNGAQLSAMLNGFKYFHVRQSSQPSTIDPTPAKNSVSLDSLLKK